MITLKYWNSLSPECRTKIAERLYGTQYFTGKQIPCENYR